ncbi:MAG: hypothetical protein ABIB97_00530 [Patescibacteria group bacterium]
MPRRSRFSRSTSVATLDPCQHCKGTRATFKMGGNAEHRATILDPDSGQVSLVRAGQKPAKAVLGRVSRKGPLTATLANGMPWRSTTQVKQILLEVPK